MYYTSQNMNSTFSFIPAYNGNLIFDADRGISAIRYIMSREIPFYLKFGYDF